MKDKSQLILKKDKKLAIQYWKGETTKEEFEEIIEKTFKYIEKGVINTVISNTTEQRPIEANNFNHALKYIELYKKHGLKKLVFVNPKSLFNQILVNKFIKASNFNEIKSFEKQTEAEKWALST